MKVDLKELGYDPRNCMDLAEDRDQWRVYVWKNEYRVLVRRSEGKSSMRRPRRTWEDNIKIDLKEVGFDAGD